MGCCFILCSPRGQCVALSSSVEQRVERNNVIHHRDDSMIGLKNKLSMHGSAGQSRTGQGRAVVSVLSLVVILVVAVLIGDAWAVF